MNQIEWLYRLDQKKERIILGLMSGTSLDGLDIALCRFRGSYTETIFNLLEFCTVPYDKVYKDYILEVFSKKKVNLQKLCLLNSWVGNYHAELVNKQLKKWNIESSFVDVVASHGQTVYHAPKSLHNNRFFENATLQIGDGDHLAIKTGILTLSDFRQKHIANGGEGAPLAMYGDYFLANSSSESRILLNIGGISNLTYLPKSKIFEDIICSDIGPGNILLDSYVKRYFLPLQYDKDSNIAKRGIVNNQLLEVLLSHSYFKKPLPKTTGPELFNLEYLEQSMQLSHTNNIPKEDVMRTLTHFTAISIGNFIDNYLPKSDYNVYCSGGGYSNPLLIKLLEVECKRDVKSSEAIGIDPNAKESILFASLANETLFGTISDSFELDNQFLKLGKLSFPLLLNI